MKAEKEFSILAKFPTLPSAFAEQLVTVKAEDMGLAVDAAWRSLRLREHVRGRHITEAVFTVVAMPNGGRL